MINNSNLISYEYIYKLTQFNFKSIEEYFETSIDIKI